MGVNLTKHKSNITKIQVELAIRWLEKANQQALRLLEEIRIQVPPKVGEVKSNQNTQASRSSTPRFSMEHRAYQPSTSSFISVATEAAMRLNNSRVLNCK